MKTRRIPVIITLCICVLLPTVGCGKTDSAKITKSMTNDVTIACSGKTYLDTRVIDLSESKATVDGVEIEEFDYTWNCDPSVSHDEVKNAPAEFYTGTKPDSEEGIYIDHELYYYPLLDESGFVKVNYDGEREWAYYYKDGENEDYIFATLPALGEGIPVNMMHSAQEASENKVLHINESGTYVIKGSWKGQIKIDLGEDAYSDEEAKVTLILDGADIECSVAPAIIFEQVYECDNAWEESERQDATVDTSKAGANIIIADDSQNYLLGNNVFRMLKTKYKDEESQEQVKTQKKMRKTDGALYSYMSMNIDGEKDQSGLLTVDSSFEGIDSELHLSLNGGNIVVNSQDDGMNVNEDHVSVLAFRGANVTINAALGAEGDGVDSNGYILVDGGSITVNGIRVPDSALDSEDGVYYNAGTIIIDGQEKTYTPGDIFKETREEGGDFGRKDFGDKDFKPGEIPQERPEGAPKGWPEGGPEGDREGRPERMEPPADGAKPSFGGAEPPAGGPEPTEEPGESVAP